VPTKFLFPIFLKLTGRRVLVVGRGPVAASKIRGLRQAGAIVTVVSPPAFRSSDLDGQWLVVAAATPVVNRAVAKAAVGRRVFVNAVDDPPNASAYLGGVVRRAGVTFAISTDGQAPALAGLLREGLDAVLPADLDRWTRTAKKARRHWRKTAVPMSERRGQLLDALNALYADRFHDVNRR